MVDPDRAPAALTTLAQKEELLAGLGVDRLVVLPFDAALAALSPEEFAREVLAGALGARQVVVGETFRFGRDGTGTRAGSPRSARSWASRWVRSRPCSGGAGP